MKFDKLYDASRLATVEACAKDLDELLREIATIEQQLAAFHLVPAEAVDQEHHARFRRAKAALARKHRLRHAINARKGQLLFEERRALGKEQVLLENELKRERLRQQRALEAEVRARREREHREKMERIAASQAKGWIDHRTFAQIVRERYGDEVVDDIWAEVHRRNVAEAVA